MVSGRDLPPFIWVNANKLGHRYKAPRAVPDTMGGTIGKLYKSTNYDKNNMFKFTFACHSLSKSTEFVLLVTR